MKEHMAVLPEQQELFPRHDQVALHGEVDRARKDRKHSEQTESDETLQRETWEGRFDFILSCIGYCIGLGNVWRFPYLCYKNGGGAFLIPYLLMVAFVGIPMYFLELAVGQYHRSGALGIWTRIPAFKGVGYSVLIVTLWSNSSYPIVMAWALFYLFHSFRKHLPWATCDNAWNTDRCVSTSQQGTAARNATTIGTLVMANSTEDGTYGLDCGIGNFSTSMNVSPSEALVTSETEFWVNYALNRSEGIDQMGNIQWQMALMLLLVWVGCYFCIWKGIKLSGKVVYVTAVLPYFLILVLLIRGATLPGAAKGIRYYLYPNVNRLLDSQVWVDAVSQVFFSTAVGYGAAVVLGSYNKFNYNVYRSAVMVAAINSGTSILCGFAIFSVLGFLAHSLGKSVADVTASGPGLAYIVYPSALAQLPAAPFWACLFFLMLVFVGFDTQFCTLEGFFTSVIDEYPKVLRKRRKIFIALVCLFNYLVGLTMVFQGGIYVFQLIEWYAGSRIGLLFVILFESVAFGWFYGRDGFYDAIQEMIGYKPFAIFKYCWRFVIPAICFSVLILSVVRYKRVSYEGVIYPDWTDPVGWLMTISCIICVPFFIIHHLLKRCRHRGQLTIP